MDIPILMILTFALLFLHVVLRGISHDGVILRKGKNFSVREKKKILTTLDKLEISYKDSGELYAISQGMCDMLKSGICNYKLYDELCKTYHNPEYYRKMELKTNIYTTSNGFWWHERDFASRYKATLILKNAIIND